jgi:hypothetical protein
MSESISANDMRPFGDGKVVMHTKYVFFVALLAGCATTRIALEKPVAGRCESSGLQECAAITDGVIMYAEGDQRLAYQKLHIAAGTNEPDDVIAFAAALRTVNKEPGAARHATALDEIAEVLAREAREAADRLDAKMVERAAIKRKKPPASAIRVSTEEKKGDPDSPDGTSARVASDAANAMRGTGDVAVSQPNGEALAKGKALPVAFPSLLPIAEVEGRTIVPATDEGNRSCVMSGIMSPSAESSRGYCVRAARGPLVVTDLHSSSACPAELFAIAVVPGDLSAPRWAVYGQPSSAINVSSGALVVHEGEQFVVGVMSSSDQKIKRDIRCAVTWSGWRPGVKGEAE